MPLNQRQRTHPFLQGNSQGTFQPKLLFLKANSSYILRKTAVMPSDTFQLSIFWPQTNSSSATNKTPHTVPLRPLGIPCQPHGDPGLRTLCTLQSHGGRRLPVGMAARTDTHTCVSLVLCIYIAQELNQRATNNASNEAICLRQLSELPLMSLSRHRR